MQAVQLHSEAGLSTCGGLDPRTIHPGRFVTHVLLMPALQIRDPVLLLVLVKAYDLSSQCVVLSEFLLNLTCSEFVVRLYLEIQGSIY